MLISDSMFLCEINIDSLTNFNESNDINIQIQFTDVFSLDLAKPNDRKPKKHRKRRKAKDKYNPSMTEVDNVSTLQTGRTVLFESDIATLKSAMEQYPMELSLRERGYENKIGSTLVPWSPAHIDYLNKILNDQEPPPVSVKRSFNIFNEYTSRCMAVVNLNIKLIYIKDKGVMSPRSSSPESMNPTKELELPEDLGTIRTVSGGRKESSKKLHKHAKDKRESKARITERLEVELEKQVSNNDEVVKPSRNKAFRSIVTHAKSDTDLNHHKQIMLFKTKSCTTISSDKNDILSFIYDYNLSPLSKQAYCVGYFTVEGSSKSTTPKSGQGSSATKSDAHTDTSAKIDLDKVNFVKCDRVDCEDKEYRKLPEPVDERILLDLVNLDRECCKDKIEEVVGAIQAKMKVKEGDPCFCECECKFGFVKRTTFCQICGGYEISGEELARKLPPDMPYPCPVFHNLIDKNKKSDKVEGKKKGKSGKDSDKGKLSKNNKFKFNFGYTGIPPHIGHSQCAMPCTGTMENVPKTMGWLWTAGNVPGLKFRPAWKPGAIAKTLLRKLRIAKNPDEASKKKKKVSTKAVKKLKRPLLVVHKQEGEYTVTMETMKQYPKPRMINQQPYEDKPVLTYTVGRTDEENLERRKKKERERRRMERAQRHFIESTFSDLCKDICMKTYHQALGIMPYDEIPDCACNQVEPSNKYCDLDHSCSCSEDESLTDTDFTDSDEWILEFTPPNALFDPQSKAKRPIYNDMETQYTYLDYRVELFDRRGNPVPRFFKGPDGKKECSDLGGFWGPDKTWLEINVDGVIGQDEKWAPTNFIGPNNDTVDAPDGRFQITGGVWLEVGIDGFVDAQGKWKWYPNRKQMAERKVKALAATKKKVPGAKAEVKMDHKESQTEWSCFGDATPRLLSEMGIVGHGQDKKLLLKTLRAMVARGEDVTIPKPSTVPRMKKRRKRPQSRLFEYEETLICKHPVPSSKGVIAVDDLGNKAYFKIKDPPNRRPKDRLHTLENQGISMSSFHVPCLDSYTNTLKRHQTTQLGGGVSYAGRARTVTTEHRYRSAFA